MGGKIYYTTQRPAWFQLPARQNEIKISPSEKSILIPASHCSKTKRPKEYKLDFGTPARATEYLAKLRKHCPAARRRLTASELLARWQRRPTSAEVVLGPLLEE